MRWFVVFLLVANVVLYFWVEQQSRPGPSSAELVPPDIGRLRLMSELEPDAAAEVPAAAEESHPAAPAQPLPEPQPGNAPDVASGVTPGELAEVSVSTLSSPVKPPASFGASGVEGNNAGERHVEPVQSALAVETQVAPTVAAETVPQEGSVPVLADGPATMPAVPKEPVVALETEPASAPPAIPEQAVQPDVAAEDTGQSLQAVTAVCGRIGPLDAEQADQLVQALPDDLTLVADTTREYSVADGFFVMIPPLPSRSVGRDKVRELADAGVTDTWLFPSGEYQNAISLGLFRQESSARRHAENVAAKGFETEVRARTSQKEGRWLLLRRDDGDEIAAGLTLPAGVEVESLDCP